jgi:cytoskeleton protein RodZ
VRRNRWLERYTWAASYVVGTALLLPLLYWLVSSESNPLASQLKQADSSAQTVTEQAAPEATVANPTPPAPVQAPADLPQAQTLAEPSMPADESYPAPVTASLTPFGLGRGAAVSQSTPSGNSLKLKLDAPSWVSVENASGERLVYRTLAAGEHSFDASMLPLRVRIGNAARAELFIDGQALTLEPYIRGNVAELALSSGAQGIEAARPQD